MERLIVFGCSLTYGQGLPDCIMPCSNPSRLGWPSILAKHMNRDCVNMSSPGSSNKRIWNTILNFNFVETDVVFILWSYPDRTSIIKKDSIIDINAWSDLGYYKSFYDEFDSNLMSKLFVNHANEFLKSKNIQTYNLVVKDSIKTILTFADSITKHIPIYIIRLSEFYPYAIDGCHPGIECNQTFAKQILEFLNVSNDIPHNKPYGIMKRLLRDRAKCK